MHNRLTFLIDNNVNDGDDDDCLNDATTMILRWIRSNGERAGKGTTKYDAEKNL